MVKPVLPPCSVEDCDRAAGAVINELLLCGEHAVIELKRVIEEREALLRRSDGESNRELP